MHRRSEGHRPMNLELNMKGDLTAARHKKRTLTLSHINLTPKPALPARIRTRTQVHGQFTETQITKPATPTCRETCTQHEDRIKLTDPTD